MACAAVVSLVAATNSVTVAAYRVAAPTVNGDTLTRPPSHISKATAAIPDRNAEIWETENASVLRPAPPVENNNAAASAYSRPVVLVMVGCRRRCFAGYSSPRELTFVATTRAW